MILFRKLCIRAPPRHPHCPLSPSIPRRHCIFAHAAPSTYHGTYFGSFTDLEPWQRQRIEEAFDVGRRKVAIKQLAGDTRLPRQQVLNYLKWWGSLDPDVRKDLQASRRAADQAVKERRAGLAQHRRAAAAADSQSKTLHEIRGLKRQRRQENSQAQAAKLMEVLFLKGTKYPSNTLVTEICDATGVRSSDVIEWFKNRRRDGKGSLYESAEDDWDEFK